MVQKTGTIYKRMDNRIVLDGENEIRLFAIARNESLRLPYFLQYYKHLGVDRIFLIDNNSTDSTREIALSERNVHVFKIDEDFKHFWYWIEYFLKRYGNGKWCVVVDIDELLSYPYAESLSLRKLITWLDHHNFTALNAILLDMYSDKPLKEVQYQPGKDPIKICPFFDDRFLTVKRTFRDKKRWKTFEIYSCYGGMRQRVFGRINGRQWFLCLSKVPLFKYSEKTYLVEGQHAINGANMADIKGVVFHTKFLSDFIHEAKRESVREQHYRNGLEYKIYHSHLYDNPELILTDRRSKRFRDSKQLVQLGIMRASEDYLSYLNRNNRRFG